MSPADPMFPPPLPYLFIVLTNRIQFMDMMGKWSLIDFFVMTMFMCAFYFELALVPQLVIYVNVVPHWGFYGFLLATMMSLGQ